jgi:pyruvate/2-oxoglutarate dehydrogenase complex dihydrolipoamide dehydrogenase (E3) component
MVQEHRQEQSNTERKNLAWTMGRAGRRTAVVERKLIGGSCPNIACLPSKNIIHSAKVAHLARHGADFGVITEKTTVEMAGVRARKRRMVDSEVRLHLDLYKVSGAELIMGEARFTAPKTVEVKSNTAGCTYLAAIRSFWTSGLTQPFPMCPVWKPPSQ